MVDIRRFAKADSGRMKLKLPDYSSPFQYILEHDQVDTGITKLDHAIKTQLDNKIHNSLASIQGDSPYYHVATAVYQALTPFGGYTPGPTNPFATTDWVNNQIAAADAKRAWGEIIPNSYIYFNTGTIGGSGSYNGDTGFVNTPAFFLSCKYASGQTNTEHHGWQLEYSGLTKDQVYVNKTASNMPDPQGYWMAAGL